jgi:hypothetical protein
MHTVRDRIAEPAVERIEKAEVALGADIVACLNRYAYLAFTCGELPVRDPEYHRAWVDSKYARAELLEMILARIIPA